LPARALPLTCCVSRRAPAATGRGRTLPPESPPMRKLAWLCFAPLLPVPGGAASQTPPNTVFLEALTVVEIQEAVASGKTTAIVATAGTEQNGPHMVMGKHRYILEYTTDKIARRLGDALVAPIITYVPEGNLDPPSGHMRY